MNFRLNLSLPISLPFPCLTFFLSTFGLLAEGKSPSPETEKLMPISSEGQGKKATHHYLFDTFAKDRKTKYIGEGIDKGLKEITILEETHHLRHGDELALPPRDRKNRRPLPSLRLPRSQS